MSIYLDNGATSYPKAPGVGEAMLDYVNNVGANVNRSTYATASTAAMILLDTREQLCRLFNFDDPTHVIFTPGMTAGLNMLLKGYLKPGDHVIVSSMEHNAMMRPLVQLEKEGVEFSRIPADEEGITKAEDILPLIRPNTKLVAVMHASNVCGSLLPVKEIGQICRERNIPFILDAAQTAGHYPIDFKELNLSALCAPGHKGLLGPQGIGVMLIDSEFAKSVEPLIAGGTGSASDSEVLPPYMPDRFESGTMNIPGVYGLNAALTYILEQGVDTFRAHEAKLTQRFIEGLKGIPVRLAGTEDMDRRVGVIAVDFTGHDNAEAAFALEQAGILTRCGLHCAPSAHKTLGTFPQGVVRFSLGYASTEADVDGALEAIRAIAK
ncbi:MAG: aminotransferase class V-fold PLP-dependent enzyme [Clostridia bacterium]|nr:aminotransferase class V-fold PLP-dependent enzyme [Clostridia bacterium]